MKRILALSLAVAALLSLCACTGESAPTQSATENPRLTTVPEETEPILLNPLTAQEAVMEMKIGWSLGNTFDAPQGETAWGMPFTTQEMIAAVHDMGFNTLRLPVSWGLHTSGAPDYIIDEAWLKRVETIVDYALELDMYVILNTHHDCDFYMPVRENEENAKAYIHAIWTQLSAYFADKDHHLIFETMNEPRAIGRSYEWWVDTGNADCMACIDVINVLNQTALDAIRAGGGYNAERFVMVPSYAACADGALNGNFKLPQDSAEDKLMVSVHAYSPYDLCLNVNSPVSEFSRKDFSQVATMMQNLYHRYVKHGIPVVIGETGIINKNNPDARYEWAKNYISTAKQYGIVCCVWDNGVVSGAGELFGLLDRRNVCVHEASATLLQGLMDGLAEE